MFGLTALETRLAAYGILLAVICGGLLWERHAGAAECRGEQRSADTAQVAQDRQTAEETIRDLRQKLAALPSAAPADKPLPTMRLCNPARNVRAQPTTPGAQSSGLSNGGADQGVRGGSGAAVQPGEAGPDVGPFVQLLEDSGVLAGTGYGVLWEWSVKQAKTGN